jgi:hypothetical protein
MDLSEEQSVVRGVLPNVQKVYTFIITSEAEKARALIRER